MEFLSALDRKAEESEGCPVAILASSHTSLDGILRSLYTDVRQLEMDLTATHRKLVRLSNITRKSRFRLFRLFRVHGRRLMQSAPVSLRAETALAEVVLAAQEKARSMASHATHRRKRAA